MTAADVTALVLSSLGVTVVIVGMAAAILAADRLGCRRWARRARQADYDRRYRR